MRIRVHFSLKVRVLSVFWPYFEPKTRGVAKSPGFSPETVRFRFFRVMSKIMKPKKTIMKTNNVHDLHGTYRGDRHGDRPNVPIAEPKCPTWLRADAKKIFRKEAKRLLSAKMVTELDEGQLAIYASAMARLIEVEKALDSLDTYETPNSAGGTQLSALFRAYKVLGDRVEISRQGFRHDARCSLQSQSHGQRQEGRRGLGRGLTFA